MLNSRHSAHLKGEFINFDICLFFWCATQYSNIKDEQSESLFYSYNNDIGYCQLHKMLKKTKLITIIIHIINSTYTISYLIGVRPVLISIDHRSRAALDNRKGGRLLGRYGTELSQVNKRNLVPVKYQYNTSDNNNSITNDTTNNNVMIIRVCTISFVYLVKLCILGDFQ